VHAYQSAYNLSAYNSTDPIPAAIAEGLGDVNAVLVNNAIITNDWVAGDGSVSWPQESEQRG
jgi:hypothetical protein